MGGRESGGAVKLGKAEAPSLTKDAGKAKRDGGAKIGAATNGACAAHMLRMQHSGRA